MSEDTKLAYIQSLNARRRKLKIWAWTCIGIGLLIFLDAGWRFPIWLTGIWAFALGTPFIVVGLWLLAASQKLPIREALMFASLHEGNVTAPSLSVGLDVTLETAELILDELVKKGYAQVSTKDMETGTVSYTISGLQKL